MTGRRMRKFTVLRHPTFGYADAVPEGWSWNAFSVAHLWALYHRLWFFFLGLCGLNWVTSNIAAATKDYFLLRYGSGPIDDPSLLLLDAKLDIGLSTAALVPVLIAAGMLGNRMLVRKFLQQGYEVAAYGVAARSRAGAVLAITAPIRSNDTTTTTEMPHAGTGTP